MATDWLDDDALLAALTDGPPAGLSHLTGAFFFFACLS
jgi:hypothetical protein